MAISTLNDFHIDKTYIDWLVGLNTLIIFSYFVFDTRAAILFSKAEIQRRLGFIDNSFNTKFDERRSNDFFTNEDIDPSIYKMAVNNFESCFTTYTVLNIMFKRARIINSIILCIFLSTAIMGEKNLFRLIVELPVFFSVFGKTIKLYMYRSKTEEIFNKYRELFNDISSSNKFTKVEIPKALKNTLDYETIVSWANTPTKDSIFIRFKPSMDARWRELKEYYSIREVNVD